MEIFRSLVVIFLSLSFSHLTSDVTWAAINDKACTVRCELWLLWILNSADCFNSCLAALRKSNPTRSSSSNHRQDLYVFNWKHWCINVSNVDPFVLCKFSRRAHPQVWASLATIQKALRPQSVILLCSSFCFFFVFTMEKGEDVFH